jgi:hypothetical protein
VPIFLYFDTSWTQSKPKREDKCHSYHLATRNKKFDVCKKSCCTTCEKHALSGKNNALSKFYKIAICSPLGSVCLQLYFFQNISHKHPCDGQMASAAHLFEFLFHHFQSIICNNWRHTNNNNKV